MNRFSKYNKWRKAVIKAYYGRCPHCGGKITGGVHHIFPRGIEVLKYVIENGIPCCMEFHRMWENPKIKKTLIKKYIKDNVYFKLSCVASGTMTIEDAEFEEIV